MKPFPAENAAKGIGSIFALLLTRGLGGTLEHFCTFSAFSVLSPEPGTLRDRPTIALLRGI